MVFALGNMSIIETSGDGYDSNLCEDVASWFMNKFLQKYDDILVEIEHVRLDNYWTYGYCGVIGSCIRPRHFMIELQPFMPEEKYIKTLFHELTHMKQWIEYRLTWDGQKSYFCQEPVEDYDYWDQPHEVEARNEEQRLYDLYLSDNEGVPAGEPSYNWSNRLTRAL